ncbi:hypothetical protein B0H14DRAFT_3868555 [Mycena olivaceomarginata]|nr:hypothetical protein B0H14DRAFT_3868555 [Mycena olivaceomarginata]
MPSAFPIASDTSDAEETTKKVSPSRKRDSEVEDSKAQESGGCPPANKIGHLVSWKEYGPEHNSWVAEDDAGNATDLIKAFWDKKKWSPAKSAEVKRPRISVPNDASDADDSAHDERSAKKPRKASEKKAPARKSPFTEPEQAVIGDMRDHIEVLDITSWDHVVDKVDNVARVDDTPFVYFTLTTGDHVRGNSKQCADKFPRKVAFPKSTRRRFNDGTLLQLIDFYESNLPWKGVNH